MVTFNFRVEDMGDPAKISEALLGGVGALSTSASKDPRRNPFDVTVPMLSEILLELPGRRSVADLTRSVQNTLFGTLGALSELPDLAGAVPEYILERGRALGQIFDQDIKAGFNKEQLFSPTDRSGKTPRFAGSYDIGTREYVDKVVALAKSEIGYEENPKGTNKTKFSDKNVPWSMMFLRSIFYDSDIPQSNLLRDTPLNTLVTMESLGRAGADPVLGAVAMLDFKGRRNPNLVNRAGIVVRVDGDSFDIVEGDTLEQDVDPARGLGVYLKTYRTGDTAVSGFVYPVYPDGTVVPYPVEPSTAQVQDGKELGAGDLRYEEGGLEIIAGQSFSWVEAQGANTDAKAPQPGTIALWAAAVKTVAGDAFEPDFNKGHAGVPYGDAESSLPGKLCHRGSYAYRPIRGSTSGALSIHSEGRAVDIGVAVNPEGKNIGDRVFLALAKNAVALGLQRIIWHRQIWDARRPDGAPFTGSAGPHLDHLHVEQSREKADTLTYEEALLIMNPVSSPVANPYI